MDRIIIVNLFSNNDLNGLSFAQNTEGKWGYKPSGADTVIPFKSGGELDQNVTISASASTSINGGASGAYVNASASVSCNAVFNFSLKDDKLIITQISNNSSISISGKGGKWESPYVYWSPVYSASNNVAISVK